MKKWTRISFTGAYVSVKQHHMSGEKGIIMEPENADSMSYVGNAGGTGTHGTFGSNGDSLTEEEDSNQKYEAYLNNLTRTGGTGGTGASGLGGDVGKAVSSVLDMNQSVNSFAQTIALRGLLGVTNEDAAVVEQIDDESKSIQTLAEKSREFSNIINGKTDVDVLIGEILDCQKTLNMILDKTNAINAYFAYMQGFRLLRLQGIRSQQNSRDWCRWISNQLPGIKKRSREKYMALASIPGVENHLEYGVERLAEFGSFYTTLTDEARKELGDDPFKHFISKFMVSDDSTYEERREKVDAVLELNKLAKLGVSIDINTMEGFLRREKPLTGEERRAVKKLHDREKDGPEKLFQSFLKKEFGRNFLINAAEIYPILPNSPELEVSDSKSLKTKMIPNIERHVVTLGKTLRPFIEKQIMPSNISRDALVDLKKCIEKLLAISKESHKSQDVPDTPETEPKDTVA